MEKELINCIVICNNSKSIPGLEKLLSSVRNFKISTSYMSPDDAKSLTDKEKFNLSLYIIENEDDLIQAKDLITNLQLPEPTVCILKNEDYKAAFELTKAGADDCLIQKNMSLDNFEELAKTAAVKKNSIITPSSLELLIDFVKNVKIGCAVFNSEGVMIDCNESFQTAFDSEKDILLKSSLQSICEPLQPEDLIRYESFLYGESPVFDHNKQVFHENGDSEWYRLSVSFVKGDSLIPSIYLMKISNITNDIDSRKKLEEEKYLLQTLMDNIPDAIYFKDYAHRYIKISKHSHLIGISKPENAIGKTDFDFTYNEQTKNAFNDEEFIIRTGYSIVNKVDREQKSDNESLWISTTKAPLYDTKGNITGIVGISRDISDLKKKEEALSESEERYRNLIEYFPDTIAVVIENVIVFTNNSGVQLMKAKGKDEILNKNINDFLSPGFVKMATEIFNKAILNKSAFKIPNARLISLSGEPFNVEVIGIPTTYFNKPAIQLILRDITESKRQERLKHTSLTILQASNNTKTLGELFKKIHLIITNWMPAQNFYIALYDEAQDLISFPYNTSKDTFEPRKFGKGLVEYLIDTGKAYLFNEPDVIKLNKKGKFDLSGIHAKVWLGVPLVIGDKTIGAMVVQDYTNPNTFTGKDKAVLEFISFTVSRAIERKLAEDEKLKYIEQLKESNSTKDRFFSLISHDLRGPFSSLLGFSQLVLDDFENLINQSVELKQYLVTINSSAKNVYNLLNNLLQFSRFQTGRYNFNPVRFNLSDLIIRNIELLKGNALKKEIEIENNVCKDCFISADQDMIGSAIQNLLTNSIKFTSRGGKVCICSSVKDKKEIEIIVEDNGIGMSEETLAKLFRIDIIQTTAGTEKEAGTGLGLLIIKECVEKNHGRITVESTPGKGSKFIITLPLVQ